MDAKQRASFINSIGAQPGQPAEPKPEAAGFSMKTEEENRPLSTPETSPFDAADPAPATPFAAAEPAPAAAPFAAAEPAPAAPQEAPASAFAAVKEQPAAPAAAAVQAEEEENAFAQGLPAWDLVPPQLAVRKRRSV